MVQDRDMRHSYEHSTEIFACAHTEERNLLHGISCNVFTVKVYLNQFLLLAYIASVRSLLYLTNIICHSLPPLHYTGGWVTEETNKK
jgi:hypothetical protein